MPEEMLLNCLPGRNTFRGNRTGLIPHYTEVCVYLSGVGVNTFFTPNLKPITGSLTLNYK